MCIGTQKLNEVLPSFFNEVSIRIIHHITKNAIFLDSGDIMLFNPFYMRPSHCETSLYKSFIMLKVFIIRLFNLDMEHVHGETVSYKNFCYLIE